MTMRPETLRKRIRSMIGRLQRDFDTLERIFKRTDWDAGDDATEALRNLGTAIAWLKGIPSMSDAGLIEAMNVGGDGESALVKEQSS